MNGRIYDPRLGRMLSPDPVTQAPENGQNYNRYTYVFNNPLKYTDPSGFVCYQLNSHPIINDKLATQSSNSVPCPGNAGGFYVDINGNGRHDEFYSLGQYPYWDSSPTPVIPTPTGGMILNLVPVRLLESYRLKGLLRNICRLKSVVLVNGLSVGLRGLLSTERQRMQFV